MRKFTLTLLLNLAFMLTAILLASHECLAQGSSGNSSFDQGLAQYYQKRWAESAELFEDAFKKDPLSAMAVSFYLDANYKNNNLMRAVNHLEQQSIDGGNTPELKAHLGIAYFARGKLDPNMLDEALNQLKEALKDNPDLSIANTGMGMIYFQKRLIPRSKGYFIKALKSNENDLLALELLGNILMVDEQKPDAAIEFFQKVIKLAPNYADGYFQAASAYQRMGKNAEAIQYFQKCMEIDPLGVASGYDAPIRIGDIYLAEKNYDEALKYYKKALNINPENPYVKTQMEKAQARGKEWKGEKYNPLKEKINPDNN